MKRSIILGFVAAAAFGCGRSDKNDNNKTEQNLRVELDQKSSEAQELAERARRLEAELNDARALNEELPKKKAELEAVREQLSAKVSEISALNSRIADQENHLNKLNEKIKTLNDDLEAARNSNVGAARIHEMEQQLAKLREEAANHERALDKMRLNATEIQKEREALVQLIGSVTKPMQGLWSYQLDKKDESRAPCRLFLHLQGPRYQKMVICGKEGEQEDGILQASYELGSFERFELHHLNTHTVDFHRRLFVKPTQSTCTDSGFMRATKSFAWTEGAPTLLAIDTTDGEVDGLTQDQSNSARNCEEVLAHPDRIGLAKAVLACRVFGMNQSELAAATQLGCFKTERDQILGWQRQAPKPLP